MPQALDNWTRDNKVTVKFRRIHTDAKPPEYIHSGDAGMDIYLHISHPPLVPGEIRIIPVGFAVEIPKGYELQVRSRSGCASRGLIVINSPGTIDSSYVNEVGVILWNVSGAIQPLEKGARVAQLVLNKVPEVSWQIVDEIPDTGRGEGFGSSGG
jgi:dUTP pyrophosphatase